MNGRGEFFLELSPARVVAVVVALLVFLLATRREESEVARVLLTIATQRSLLLRHP